MKHLRQYRSRNLTNGIFRGASCQQCELIWKAEVFRCAPVVPLDSDDFASVAWRIDFRNYCRLSVFIYDAISDFRALVRAVIHLLLLLMRFLNHNIHREALETRGEDKAKLIYYPLDMDEGRKRTILIAASILVARKCAQLEGKMSPALDAAIADAISVAERMMHKIDNRSANPPPTQSMTSSAGYPWKEQR